MTAPKLAATRPAALTGRIGQGEALFSRRPLKRQAAQLHRALWGKQGAGARPSPASGKGSRSALFQALPVRLSRLRRRPHPPGNAAGGG